MKCTYGKRNELFSGMLDNIGIVVGETNWARMGVEARIHLSFQKLLS